MKKTIYLHIGFGKTGTTSIQKTLLNNYDKLLSCSVLYPKTGIVDGCHHGLAILGLDNMTDDIHNKYKYLIEEIEYSNCEKVILSSENFCFVKDSYVKEIHEYFKNYECNIIFYYRNQIDLIESTYLQWIKDKGNYNNIESFFEEHYNAFDFNLRVYSWKKYFRQNHFYFRLFDSSIIGENVVDDFMQLINITCDINKEMAFYNLSLLPDFSKIAVNINNSKVLHLDEKQKMIRQLLKESDIFKKFSSFKLMTDTLKSKIKKKLFNKNKEFSKNLDDYQKNIFNNYLENIPYYKAQGYCPCCDNEVTFESKEAWLRDFYLCSNCSSIPRERHLSYIIEKILPNWKNLIIHESSPAVRGTSEKLRKNCKNYIASHYYPNSKEEYVNGYKNIDLHYQNFEDESFDLVVTQDVFEHLPYPELAIKEIARTLKKGGYFISTIPLVNKFKPTQQWAELVDGELKFFYEPDYHGNPIDPKGSPVFWHYGYDIASRFIEWSGMETIIVSNVIPELGIEAELLEVIVCRKI